MHNRFVQLTVRPLLYLLDPCPCAPVACAWSIYLKVLNAMYLENTTYSLRNHTYWLSCCRMARCACSISAGDDMLTRGLEGRGSCEGVCVCVCARSRFDSDSSHPPKPTQYRRSKCAPSRRSQVRFRKGERGRS